MKSLIYTVGVYFAAESPQCTTFGLSINPRDPYSIISCCSCRLRKSLHKLKFRIMTISFPNENGRYTIKKYILCRDWNDYFCEPIVGILQRENYSKHCPDQEHASLPLYGVIFGMNRPFYRIPPGDSGRSRFRKKKIITILILESINRPANVSTIIIFNLPYRKVPSV